jgi:hypothetical protein
VILTSVDLVYVVCDGKGITKVTVLAFGTHLSVVFPVLNRINKKPLITTESQKEEIHAVSTDSCKYLCLRTDNMSICMLRSSLCTLT